MKTQALPRSLGISRILLSELICFRIVHILYTFPSYTSSLKMLLKKQLAFGMRAFMLMWKRGYGVYLLGRWGYV